MQSSETTHRPTYLCRTTDGDYVYVSTDPVATADISTHQTSFKLYFGDGVTMRDIPYTDAMRFGYDLRIETHNGIFDYEYPDPPFFREGDNRYTLEMLNLDDYDIVETSEGVVTITPKV